jgi:death-on-curing protein
MEPVFLDWEDILHIHEREVTRAGGSFGVRDPGMLESAMAMPRAGFGDEYLHADLFEMAAAYLFHITMNHPFIDGNKRAGFACALAFLDVNGFEVLMDQEAAYDLVIGVCEGSVTKGALAAAFRKHAVALADQQDGS